jgi:small-conductance mechanosensitive channel/CRP-like cAMP-binding protein
MSARARDWRKAIRAESRSKLILPFLFSGGLWGVYFLLNREPLILGYLGDMRKDLFGAHLERLEFVAIAALIIFFVRLVDTLIFDVAMSRRRNVIAPQILRQILSIILYFLLFAWTLSELFHYSPWTALTGGALLAAILGLALQETLGNLFSGIALSMEGGFEAGDVLHSGDYYGVVESVSWRATRIRGVNNQLIVLPNSVIARERLEVFPHNNLNGRVLQIGVDYHVAPATVIGIFTQAAAHVEGIARERPPIARVGSFGDSAVIYEIKYYTRDYSLRERIDADVRKAVWYALQRNGIAFATPIRTYAPYTPPKAGEQVPQDEIVQRLQEVDILSPLSPPAHEQLAQATKVHVYSRGEAILHAGAAGDSMFVVHNGTVSVRLSDADTPGGYEVAQLGPGSVFGEMALLTGEKRAADVIALTDVLTLEIGKESLQPILLDHPELAGAISEKVIERRDHLALVRAENQEEESQTVLSRIRAYFGL